MLIEATKKYREPIAYGLLAVAALIFISGLSLLFKSEDDIALDFSGKSAFFGTLFADVLLVGALVLAAVVVTVGEANKNAKTVVMVALGILGLTALMLLITWLASYGYDTTQGSEAFGGVLGAGKIVGTLLNLASLILLGLAGLFLFSLLQAFPKPAPAQQQWGQPAGQQQWGQPQGQAQGQQWGQPAGQQQWGQGYAGWGEQAQAQAQQQGQPASAWGQPTNQPAQSSAQPSAWGQPGAPEQAPWGQQGGSDQWGEQARETDQRSQQEWGGPGESDQRSQQEWGGPGESDQRSQQEWGRPEESAQPEQRGDAPQSDQQGQPDDSDQSDRPEPGPVGSPSAGETRVWGGEQTDPEDDDPSKRQGWWQQPQ